MVASGVEVVHTTVSGLGERAGNSAMEPLAMALIAMYGLELNLDTHEFYALSRLVQERSGHRVPSNAPVVGDRLFEIESGIVAGFWARCAAEYPLELFPFHWSEVGQPEPRVVYGKGSGLPTLDAVDGAGPDVPESTRRAILMAIKQAAIDRKDLVSAEETRTIVKRVLAG